MRRRSEGRSELEHRSPWSAFLPLYSKILVTCKRYALQEVRRRVNCSIAGSPLKKYERQTAIQVTGVLASPGTIGRIYSMPQYHSVYAWGYEVSARVPTRVPVDT